MNPLPTSTLGLWCIIAMMTGLFGCTSKSPAPIDKDFAAFHLAAGGKDTPIERGFRHFNPGCAIPFEGRVVARIECHAVMIKLVSLASRTPVSVSSTEAALVKDGENRLKYSGVLPCPKTSGPHTLQVIHPRLGVVDELVIYVDNQ